MGGGVGGPLVGRDGEVSRLRELVGAVAGGRGAEVWVEGEPGIGKSALLAAGLAGAEQLGCQVFATTADEPGRRFPLRAVLDCLQVVAGSADPARREILELLRSGGVDGAAPADLVPAAVERLLTLVERLCAAPVVLVIDDLQWADDDSLVVWRQLSRVVPQLPLLLVAACRPVPWRAELVTLRDSAASSGAMLALEALPADPVAELVGRLLGAEAVGPGLRAAMRRAAGNPLYVRELVDALVREGRLRRDGDTADLVADEPGARVLVSLTAAISGRLGFVSKPTLELLRTAALFGGQFSVGDLGVVVGRPAPELAAVVEDAMAAGVLVESGALLAFRHELIRGVLRDGTPAGSRLARHGQAARALAAAGAAVEVVAQQLLAAFDALEASRTEPGTTPARRSEALGAAGTEPDAGREVPGEVLDATGTEPVAAPAILDWALDWLAGHGRALTSRSALVAADLLSRALPHATPGQARTEMLQALLASVLVLTGRSEDAVELAEQVRAATRDPARRAEVSWTLALALTHLLRHEQAGRMLAGALRDHAVSDVWAVRMRAQLALVVTAGGDFGQLTAAEEAMVEAERRGERYAAALAANAVIGSLNHRKDHAAALAVVERTLAMLGDDPRTADLRLLMLHNRMVMLDGLDRRAESGSVARELITAAERYAPPHRLAASRCGVAEHCYLAGRWDDALAELEILADGTIPVAPVYRLLLHGTWAVIAAHRDDATTAEAHLAAADGLPRRAGVGADMATLLVMASAVLAERGGRPERALAILTGLLDAGELNERLLWLPDLVRLALAAGDAGTARAATAAGAADAAAEPTASQTAAADHCSGLLDGDPARLLAAAGRYRDAGRPFETARAREDAAVLLADRGDSAARAAYGDAVEGFAALRADWDLRRTDARLQPYGIRRPRRRPQRPAAGWGALTPTELKVADLVAAGHSNPDIAGRLVLSRRTVDVHVSHILTKLGARSRVEIARKAAAKPATAGPTDAAPDRPAARDAAGG